MDVERNAQRKGEETTHGHERRGRELLGRRTEAVEDYAKAIFSLQRRGNRGVSTNALAEHLGLSPGAVSGMLKRMDEMHLVVHERYHGVRLTAAGEKVALEVLRHHRLIEAYLAEAFGMSWDRVHAEAEVLEHYISDELGELIAEALGDPERDPHGDPIPDRQLTLPQDETRALVELEPGESGVFTVVSDRDSSMLRYLAERDICPGVELEVEDKQPFEGPVLVRVGDQVHSLGGALARSMRVSPA